MDDDVQAWIHCLSVEAILRDYRPTPWRAGCMGFEADGPSLAVLIAIRDFKWSSRPMS
jgi:hypothetical protein